MQKQNIIPLLIRSKLIVFTILSIIGLYILWDPTYLLYSVVAFFLFSNIGHEIGLHRYYAHQSFVCKNKLIESFIWLCVFFGGISDAYSYAKRHARHHRYSDTEFDNLQTTNHPFLTWWGYGTLKATPVDISKMGISARLENSQFHKFINQHYFVLYYSTLAICFSIDIKLSFYILILGSTLAHQVGGIASIVTHKVGYRNFNTPDTSTNPTYWNLLFGIGGLHNNHHKFPYSYTTKSLPSEIDPTAWIIKHILAVSVTEAK